jgi:hypothetical protein
MTEDEKREYDEMMEDLKALGIEPLKAKNEKGEDEEILMDRFTFGDREPTILLEQNMDKAFERRFLYKVKFNKPTLEARHHIWCSMIPSLEENTATQLAQKFDFSGGQIENIARHYTIDTILHGDNANMQQALFQHCENEQLDNKNNRRIGFK